MHEKASDRDLRAEGNHRAHDQAMSENIGSTRFRFMNDQMGSLNTVIELATEQIAETSFSP
jgi:hypothetical protein